MNRPRVLVVAPRLDRGGVETHLTRVLPRLRSSGLDISVFTLGRGGVLEARLQAAGVPLLGAYTDGGRIVRDLTIARALRADIKRLRPEILHFFLTEPYLIGSLAAAGLRQLKRVMSRRSLALYQYKYPLIAGVERALHRSTTALIGNSSAVCRDLVEESGAPHKVGLIHNGIELPPPSAGEQRIATRSELKIPQHAFVAAVVANLLPYKGHADLLAAFASVQDRLAPDWRLLIVGRDRGLGSSLRAQADAAGIRDHVLWLGEREDVPRILAAADVGVLPSHEEGFSNSLLEKMAHGMAVVATRVGGNIDAVEDGESGFLVPARDPVALGTVLLRIQSEPELRERLAIGARARVERLFSIEACTQRYLNLYCGLLRSNMPICKLIDPPAGQEYRSISDELNAVRHGTYPCSLSERKRLTFML